MFKLKYDGLGLDENHLPDFVGSVSSHLYGRKVVLKDHIATGDYKILEFTNGLYAYVSNYILHQDFEMELPVKKGDFLALHINQIQAGAECKITINNRVVVYDDKIINALFLTEPKDSFFISGSSGTCVNRLKIMMPRAWLEKRPVYNEAWLRVYFELQEERLSLDTMDGTYRTMVDKVMNTEDNTLYLSVTQDIVEVIIDRFFNRLNIRIQKNQEGAGFSGKVA
ncbi:MAG: hypothetical protein ABI813_06765 [Bacteroidota bacterium]